jgi:hypothetical protein
MLGVETVNFMRTVEGERARVLRPFLVVGVLSATIVAQATPPVPRVYIETFDRQIAKSERIPAMVTVDQWHTPAGCHAEISIRGSSSSQFPKKPYRFELQDENGDDLKVALLGMPKESDWILFPAYTDKTMVRDVLTYELWRQMGYWAPRTRYVELYISRGTKAEGREPDVEEREKGGKGERERAATPKSQGEPQRHGGTEVELRPEDYEGVYVLMEKIKRGKDRLDIAKLTRSDNAEPKITGGYIFKRDRVNSPTDRPFLTRKLIELMVEEPKGRDITAEQESYLTNYVNEFERALFSDDFRDPERGYRKYIDVRSFIDYHWIVEVSKNVDGYWFSVFFHKDRNGKLRAGPVWDYDLSFGNQLYEGGYKLDGWVWEYMRRQYTWFRRMFDDPDFVQDYIDRWPELRSKVFATSNVLALVDKFAAQIGPAAYDRNYARWPTLGEKVAGNAFAGKTWQEDIEHLTNWIKGRLEWIDNQDFPKPAIAVDGGEEGEKGGKGERAALASSKFQAPSSKEAANSNGQTGRSIRMACLVGKIFYTTDGSDPRLPGGAVSEKAAQYMEAIPVTAGLKLVARVRSDYGLWSAPVVYG